MFTGYACEPVSSYPWRVREEKRWARRVIRITDLVQKDHCVRANKREQAVVAKPLRGFGGAGVLEVVEDHMGDTYRAVYTVKFAETVYVLHCFQKKSKRGIETPKHEMDVIRERLKAAQAHAQGA